jgi:hypothetical protein
MISGRKRPDSRHSIRQKAGPLQPIFHSTLLKNAGQFFELTLLLGKQRVMWNSQKTQSMSHEGTCPTTRIQKLFSVATGGLKADPWSNGARFRIWDGYSYDLDCHKLDLLTPRQVRDRTRQFQDVVIGPRR